VASRRKKIDPKDATLKMGTVEFGGGAVSKVGVRLALARAAKMLPAKGAVRGGAAAAAAFNKAKGLQADPIAKSFEKAIQGARDPKVRRALELRHRARFGGTKTQMGREAYEEEAGRLMASSRGVTARALRGRGRLSPGAKANAAKVRAAAKALHGRMAAASKRAGGKIGETFDNVSGLRARLARLERNAGKFEVNSNLERGRQKAMALVREQLKKMGG